MKKTASLMAVLLLPLTGCVSHYHHYVDPLCIDESSSLYTHQSERTQLHDKPRAELKSRHNYVVFHDHGGGIRSNTGR